MVHSEACPDGQCQCLVSHSVGQSVSQSVRRPSSVVRRHGDSRSLVSNATHTQHHTRTDRHHRGAKGGQRPLSQSTRPHTSTRPPGTSPVRCLFMFSLLCQARCISTGPTPRESRHVLESICSGSGSLSPLNDSKDLATKDKDRLQFS